MDANSGKVSLSADLRLVPLVGFRTEPVAPRESFTILWTKDGKPLPRLMGKTQPVVDDADADAMYSVDVIFTTEKVWVNKEGLLSSHRDIALSKHCL